MTSVPESRNVERSAGILTFLIADVRGYTSYTQAHGDEAAARLAATFAGIVHEAVAARDGTLVELRGDEALAVFTSPRQALQAAVELQAVFADEVALRPDVPLHVGIGLDAGEAVRVDGGYRGGALNLAARLCARAAAGEILASPEVVHLARAVAGLRYVERDDLDLKGLAGPSRAFLVTTEGPNAAAVLRRRARPAADTSADALPARAAELPPELDPMTPIVGRDDEARLLRWCWRLARRGAGRAVVLAGVPGSGKTRLAADVAALAGRDAATITYVACTGDPGELSTVRDAVHSADDAAALVVVDDAHRADAADRDALRAAIAGVDGRPLLVVVSVDPEEGDAHAPPLSQVLRDGRVLRVEMRPLDERAVEGIARLYLDDPAVVVPARTIAQAADGLPARIHELVGGWARDQTARKLGENVSRAAAGRDQLRLIETELTENVIELQHARERASLYGRDTDGASAASARVPYMGLATFEAQDAGSFFGRERLVAELIGRLAGTTFLGVVGPSGSGKSSVLRAGLVPAVESGILPGSDRWLPVVLRPGERPMRELDRAVFAALPGSLRPRLSDADDPVAAAAGALSDEQPLFVVVDQFEEVFTACPDDAERTRFVDTLVRGARSRRAVVVVAVRADFYGRCAEHADLAELLATSHVLVGGMAPDEYRRVIEQPARRAGVRVEPALVEALVADVVGEPGALPLLSTALLELWQRREGRAIRMSAYEATGGVRGAVARLAEEAYGRLSETEQRVARAAMLRLSAGDAENAVRRRVPLAEFDASSSPEVARVIAVLTEARLLTVDEGSVEIAHEALLREWPRLRDWLEEDREGRRLRQHLTVAAREWLNAGRDRGELYRGARLTSALDWTTGHTLELNELEREFIAESRAASEREGERQRRTNRRLRLLLVGVAVLFVASLAAGGLAVVRQVEAERAAALADEQRTAAERAALRADAQRLGAQALVERDLDLSLLLARQAVELDDSPETRANLLAALLRSPAAIRARRPLPGRLLNAAATPDGTRLLIDSNTTGQSLVDAASGEVLRTFDTAAVIVDDDRVLLIHDAPGDVPGPTQLRVVDSGSGVELDRTTVPGDRQGFSWSRDLQRLAIIAPDGRSIGIHDFKTLAETDRFSAPEGMPAWDLQWHGEDHLLVSLHEGPLPEGFPGTDPITFAWWRLGSDAPDVLIPQDPDDIGHQPIFAVSGDGKWMAYGHRDGTVSLYDLVSGERRETHGRHSGAVAGVRFSPDGELLLTTGDDHLAITWDVETGESLETFAGHNGSVRGPTFGALDGRPTAFTVGMDGQMIAWDLEGGRRLARPFRQATPWDVFAAFETKQGVAVSPDGSRFAVASTAGTVTVYETTSLAVVSEFDAVRDGPAIDVAFSPDGRRLAVGGVGQDVVRLWDPSTGEPIGGRLDGPPLETDLLPPEEGRVPTFSRSVAFSPDGRYLAAAVIGRRIWIWDARTGRPLGDPIQLDGGVWELGFSPDSRLLAASGAIAPDVSSVAWVFGIDDREERYRVAADTDYGRGDAVTFSPDGSLLVTGGGTGEIRFFHAADGAVARPPLLGAAGWVSALSFHPSGDLLASGATDGSVRLFDLGRHAQMGESLPAPENVGATVVFTPDGSRLVTTHDTGIGHVWDMSPDRWKEHACSVAGRRLSEAEWQQVLPDRPYAPACGG